MNILKLNDGFVTMEILYAQSLTEVKWEKMLIWEQHRLHCPTVRDWILKGQDEFNCITLIYCSNPKTVIMSVKYKLFITSLTEQTDLSCRLRNGSQHVEENTNLHLPAIQLCNSNRMCLLLTDFLTFQNSNTDLLRKCNQHPIWELPERQKNASWFLNNVVSSMYSCEILISSLLFLFVPISLQIMKHVSLQSCNIKGFSVMYLKSDSKCLVWFK